MLCKPEKEKLLFMNASANLYVRRIFMRCFMSCNQQSGFVNAKLTTKDSRILITPVILPRSFF